MCVLAAGSILYQTSNLIHKYGTEDYIPASLGHPVRLEDERCMNMMIKEPNRTDQNENIQTERNNNSASQQYLIFKMRQ